MKLVIQRCKYAQVVVDTHIVGKIDSGLVILLGYTHGDSFSKNEQAITKVLQLRVFSLNEKKNNQCIKDIEKTSGLLIISQFTLYGTIKKGTRPNFSLAANYNQAYQLYIHFVKVLQFLFSNVQTGTFGAIMEVSVVNDGPYTLIWEL